MFILLFNGVHTDIHMVFILTYVLVSVSGFGFGLVSGVFSLVNVLADMVGPGTIGIQGDSSHFFITSGKYSL